MEREYLQKSGQQNGERGFSAIEVLIVLTIMFVVTGFAVLQITRAHQATNRMNSARLFASHLEKARLDSLRRHPMTTAQMAQVSIINETFYSVSIDLNGDSTLDAPVVLSLPANSNLEFNEPYPRTIYFNWRGRTVDAVGNVATPDFVTISNSYGLTRIDLSSAGQAAFNGAPAPSSTVSNSSAPAPVFRPDTQIP